MNDNISPDQKEFYKSLVWIIFTGSVFIYFWGIWGIPTLSHNEARRMIVVREMLSNHDWLIPTLNGEIYIAKPPLFYWLGLIFSLYFQSTAEWVIRLPSALTAFGITWLIFFRVRKYIGPWPALFSVLILITCAFFSRFARRAEIEMVLTVCCACAVLFYFDYLKERGEKKYLYLSYVFLALAFLAKGPVSLVFFVPPILVFGILQKDEYALKGLLFSRGWLLFALIAFPWYLYTLLRLGGDPLGSVIQVDIVRKTVAAVEKDPFYEYLLTLLASFTPWVLILAYKTRTQIRTLFSSYEYAYFSWTFLIPLIVLSLFPVKHGKYILPLFPSFAVFLGIWLSSLFVDLRERWGKKREWNLFLGITILVLGHFLYYSVVEARVYKYRYEAFEPVIAKLRQFSEKVPVYAFQRLHYRLVYYYGHPIPVISKEKVRQIVSEGQPFLLVAESRDWKALEDENLPILMQYKPYLKRNRAVRILATPDLKSSASASKGSTPILSRLASYNHRKGIARSSACDRMAASTTLMASTPARAVVLGVDRVFTQCKKSFNSRKRGSAREISL
jgi:hypothetical protein